MTRRSRRTQMVIGGGLLAAVAIGLALSAQRLSSDNPASPAVLNRIAAKNDEAAATAAARMKSESEASAAAADARRRASEVANDALGERWNENPSRY